MHYSNSIILALAPLMLGGALAAPPIPSGQKGPHYETEMIVGLDKDGGVDWKDGHFAFVPEAKMTSHANKQAKKAKQAKKKTKAAQRSELVPRNGAKLKIMGKSADVSCFGDGRMMWTEEILEVSKVACNALVKNSATGQAAEKGWNVYRQLEVPDKKGRKADLYLAWQWISKAATTKMDKSLCEEIIDRVFTPGDGPCGQDGDTHGARINWDDQFNFIVDPWKGK